MWFTLKTNEPKAVLVVSTICPQGLQVDKSEYVSVR